MSIDMFFCIILSIIVLSKWCKHQSRKFETNNIIPKNIRTQIEPSVWDAKNAADRQREKDISELKKQGYTDELITVILPTIKNG